MKNTYICTFVQSFSVRFASLNFLKKKIKAHEVESNRALVSGAGERRFAKPMLWPPLRTPSRALGLHRSRGCGSLCTVERADRLAFSICPGQPKKRRKGLGLRGWIKVSRDT